MSMSLRDQLLQAGLINKKQANEAERQQQHKERQAGPKRGRTPAPQRSTAAPAQGAKAARDQELNRQQREKAEKKARIAQITQLIDQNRLPDAESEESYNFVDGNKIRRLPANAATRSRLARGEIVIVRHLGRYSLVPAATAARIRERDEHAIVALDAGKDAGPTDAAYDEFPVPDDLRW